MKKVLAVALLCSMSAFAAWDYFPVIEKGKGEAKISFYNSRQGVGADTDKLWKGSSPEEKAESMKGGTGMDFKIRYSPVSNLEFMSAWANSELGSYMIGARYQLIPVLSAGVDVGFPLPLGDWNFTPNIQFSTDLTPFLSLGVGFQATFYTEDQFKETADTDLLGGFELDLKLGENSTIWAGLDMGMTMDDDKNPRFIPMVGYVASIGGSLSLGTSVAFDIVKDGKDFYGDDLPMNTTVAVEAAISF